MLLVGYPGYSTWDILGWLCGVGMVGTYLRVGVILKPYHGVGEVVDVRCAGVKQE